MSTIYSLLVGIDHYPTPIPQLRGCVNDITAFECLMNAPTDKDDTWPTSPTEVRKLLDGDATRAAVVAGFREHLTQAGKNDVALFYFCGHGSQQESPVDFWATEADHLDETLVCYDSRMADSWDLADKELGKLIGEVAHGGAHVVVILDSCHSGSGTRVAMAPGVARYVQPDPRKRPLGSFICGLGDIARSRLVSNRNLSGWRLEGKHVLLAACRDDESAKEHTRDNVIRGAFSWSLTETLSKIGHTVTYYDLFARASTLVRSLVGHQTPQMEATDAQDLLRPFLGGSIRPRPSYFVASPHSGRWWIDGGRVHGIPDSTVDDPAELALFGFEVSEQELHELRNVVANCRLLGSTATTSELQIIDGQIDVAFAPYKAVFTRLPTPALRIMLEGDSEALKPVRTHLVKSKYVRESVPGECAEYRLLAKAGRYVIARTNDDRPLGGEAIGYTAEAVRHTIERLEHIERWKTTLELDNPLTSIGATELSVDILRAGERVTSSNIRLEYVRGAGGIWRCPEITIRLRNTGERTLFVGLLDLPETFGIFSLLKHVGCQKLDPGQEIFANDGEPIPVTIPDELWQRGTIELKDIVKVIVSTSSFDVRRMEQADLDLPMNRKVRFSRIEQLGTLERLMERVQFRHLGQNPPRCIDDWRTLQFSLTTIRPLPEQAIK